MLWIVLAASSLVLTPAHVKKPASIGLRCDPQHLTMQELVLSEENAVQVLEQCENELATVFGSNAESLRVGITGGVELAELDGPIMIVRLTGRFWHARSSVLDRIESYVIQRIPECIAVEVEDPAMLDDADPEAPPTRDD
jgi:hypothetical protein